MNNNLKGVGVKFHTREDIKVNSIVIIDLLIPNELRPVYVKGISMKLKFRCWHRGGFLMPMDTQPISTGIPHLQDRACSIMCPAS